MSETHYLGKYLGCPIINGRVTKNTFSDIIDKTTNQLSKWKANSISQAGRLVLIKANLASKASFLMQNFLVPKSIHKQIDKINRDFLWNKNPESKGPNLIGWDKVCRPFFLGGLGIYKAETLNKAFQMKLLWKILTEENSIWTNRVKKIYLKNDSLFEHSPPQRSSWQWRKLMSLREIFRKGLRWHVGNGKSIKFWTDNWAFPTPLISIIEDLSIIQDKLLVSDFITSEKQWNIPKLTNLVNKDIVNSILDIPIPRNDIPDKLGWGLSTDGSFSIKSASLLIQGAFNPNTTKCDFDWIWKAHLPPKIQFFLWKACLDGLPTRERLVRAHVSVPIHCVLCNHHTEDLNHFFFNCPILHIICQSVGGNDLVKFYNSQTNYHFPFFWEKLNSLKNSITAKAFLKISFIWWNLWFGRNKFIFENIIVNINAIKQTINNTFFTWTELKHKDLDNEDNILKDNHSPNSCNTDITWVKPSEEFIKMNFDGSKLNNKNAALGFSIRNHNGKVLLLGAKACGKVSVLLAETLALKEGVIAAKSMGFSNIVIEGDNLCVINSMRGVWKIPWEIYQLIVDIRIELVSFKEVKYVHCFREANKVADFMANFGHSCPSLSRWVESQWLSLSSLIRKDEMGWSYSRGST